jgi:hypothetical protein
LLQLAIRGFKTLNLHGGLVFEQEWLTLNQVNAIPYPRDCTKIISVGIPYRGRLWTFTYEGRLVAPLSEEDGVEKIDITKGEDRTIGDGNFADGYGVPGGLNKVYVKFDEENRRVIVNGFAGTQAYVTYKSTGVSLNEQTLVPAVAEEALIAWVQWQSILYKPGVNANDKQFAEKHFNRMYDAMLDTKTPPLDVLYDALYKGYTQTPKR